MADAAVVAALDAQREIVRKLKEEKAPKEQVDAAVAKLKELKLVVDSASGAAPAVAAGGVAKKGASKASEEKAPAADPSDGMTASKDGDFSEWYSQVVTKSELIDYYDISGCYILRPASYFIWDQIKNFFDGAISADGVSNCYFPLFVTKARLEAEKDHIEGFAPEVAWVTKSGDSDLAEPIAIRPTSETIMYSTASHLHTLFVILSSCTLCMQSGFAATGTCPSDSTSGATLCAGSSNTPSLSCARASSFGAKGTALSPANPKPTLKF